METTQAEKDQIRQIIRNLIADDKGWFKAQNIQVGNKGQYWILNYGPGERSEYNRLVRGMVVQKPAPLFKGDYLTLIRSFPFVRFFNHGEKESAAINFANSEMLEKLDGSMVGVFFPNEFGSHKYPEFHTRRMMSTHEDDMKLKITSFYGKEIAFLKEIGNFVKSLQFQITDVTYTYVFEFVHEASHVLTKYNPVQYGLYLLAGRNLQNHRELSEDELDIVATRIGSKRARRFQAVADHTEIEKMFAVMSAEIPDFEGYIFRDKTTGHRVKVKDPNYVHKHHLIDDLSYKNLIPRILEGEADEILSYFPHAKKSIDLLTEAYNKYLAKIIEKILYWKSKNLSNKDLAMILFGSKLPPWETGVGDYAEPDRFILNCILKLFSFDEKVIREKTDQILRAVALGNGKNSGSPKKLIELLDLQEETTETNDIGEI